MTGMLIDRTAARDLDNAGIRARRVVTITGPTSYTNTAAQATSGEPLLDGDFKLAAIEAFPAGGLIFCDFTGGAAAVRIATYDYVNDRLRFFIPNTGAEVANAVNLSAFTCRLEVLGK